MRRGAVWWVAFDPTLGSEIAKTRPAVIVSNGTAVARQRRVQVVPLTSNTAKTHSWEALVQVGGRASKALADQIRTVDKSRLIKRYGDLAPAEMAAIERALRVQLGL